MTKDEEDRAWKHLTDVVRRRVRKDGETLVVTRGANPEMMIVDDRNRVVAGPVAPSFETLREWAE